MTDRPEFTHRRVRRGLIGPFGGRQLLAGAIVILVVGVLLVVVTTPLGSVNPISPNDPQATPYTLGAAPANGLRVGEVPPELTITGPNGQPASLTDLDGRPVRLADLRGKAVWVNFWTTWCPPCQSEVPILRDMSERYRDRGLELVAISVQETSPADVASYAARYGLGYTIGFDGSGKIFHAYKGFGLPTQVFIDENGVIASIVGAPLDEAGATAQIEAILPRDRGAGSSPSTSAAP